MLESRDTSSTKDTGYHPGYRAINTQNISILEGQTLDCTEKRLRCFIKIWLYLVCSYKRKTAINSHYLISFHLSLSSIEDPNLLSTPQLPNACWEFPSECSTGNILSMSTTMQITFSCKPSFALSC